MSYKSEKVIDVECNDICYLIAVDHCTIRQVAELMNLSKGSVEYRLARFKKKYPSRYEEVQKVLNYNKRYRFTQRYLWLDFDPAFL